MCRDGLGRDPPGACNPGTGKSLEVKLAADGGVRAASVRHVVAVEGHHVAQDLGAALGVCSVGGAASVGGSDVL